MVIRILPILVGDCNTIKIDLAEKHAYIIQVSDNGNASLQDFKFNPQTHLHKFVGILKSKQSLADIAFDINETSTTTTSLFIILMKNLNRLVTSTSQLFQNFALKVEFLDNTPSIAHPTSDSLMELLPSSINQIGRQQQIYRKECPNKSPTEKNSFSEEKTIEIDSQPESHQVGEIDQPSRTFEAIGQQLLYGDYQHDGEEALTFKSPAHQKCNNNADKNIGQKCQLSDKTEDRIPLLIQNLDVVTIKPNFKLFSVPAWSAFLEKKWNYDPITLIHEYCGPDPIEIVSTLPMRLPIPQNTRIVLKEGDEICSHYSHTIEMHKMVVQGNFNEPLSKKLYPVQCSESNLSLRPNRPYLICRVTLGQGRKEQFYLLIPSSEKDTFSIGDSPCDISVTGKRKTSRYFGYLKFEILTMHWFYIEGTPVTSDHPELHQVKRGSFLGNLKAKALLVSNFPQLVNIGSKFYEIREIKNK